MAQQRGDLRCGDGVLLVVKASRNSLPTRRYDDREGVVLRKFENILVAPLVWEALGGPIVWKKCKGGLSSTGSDRVPDRVDHQVA